MKKINFLFVAISFLVSCASLVSVNEDPRISQPMKNWATEVRTKVEPIWRDEIKRRIKNLESKGLAPLALDKSDKAIMRTELIIRRDGTIEDAQIVKKSKYAFLNESSQKIFEKVNPLPKPPEDCLQGEVCKVYWDFVIQN